MSEGGEGFLSRWSRRKRAAAAEPPAPPAAATAPAAPVPPGAAEPAAGAGPAFDPASLPPVDSLTADSDFAAFLREEVPAALKRAALRRAWTLDPAIRDFVGPADYAWDFNAPGGVPGFSLEAPRNLERLIAQAVGSPPPEEEPREDEEPTPLAEAVLASAEPPPLPSPDPAAPDGPLSVEAPPTASLASGAPVPVAPPEAAALAGPVAEALPVRRRHGGALPS